MSRGRRKWETKKLPSREKNEECRRKYVGFTKSGKNVLDISI